CRTAAAFAPVELAGYDREAGGHIQYQPLFVVGALPDVEVERSLGLDRLDLLEIRRNGIDRKLDQYGSDDRDDGAEKILAIGLWHGGDEAVGRRDDDRPGLGRGFLGGGCRARQYQRSRARGHQSSHPPNPPIKTDAFGTHY